MATPSSSVSIILQQPSWKIPSTSSAALWTDCHWTLKLFVVVVFGFFLSTLENLEKTIAGAAHLPGSPSAQPQDAGGLDAEVSARFQGCSAPGTPAVGL